VKTHAILRRNAIAFCAFEGKCHFKKLATEENERQPKPQCAICIWKDRCKSTNQSSKSSSILMNKKEE